MERVPSNGSVGFASDERADAKLGEHLATLFWRGHLQPPLLERWFELADDDPRRKSHELPGKSAPQHRRRHRSRSATADSTTLGFTTRCDRQRARSPQERSRRLRTHVRVRQAQRRMVTRKPRNHAAARSPKMAQPPRPSSASPKSQPPNQPRPPVTRFGYWRELPTIGTTTAGATKSETSWPRPTTPLTKKPSRTATPSPTTTSNAETTTSEPSYQYSHSLVSGGREPPCGCP